ncbi:hypothetical protein AB0I16_27650 [Streptomyces sp. NPDC050703]|uniref:hypothetical protein n=1 Tax=Streptomyces sp. NPDC050703 TaxID=3157218 RepID=UPI00343C28F8
MTGAAASTVTVTGAAASAVTVMTDVPDERQAAIHRQIAERLAELVPSDPALPPHPYLRRHLAEHAAQGHVLDDEHVPLALLAWESSAQVGRLLAAGREEGGRSRWLRAWAALEPFARGVGPVSRLSSLRLARHAAGPPAPAADTATGPGPDAGGGTAGDDGSAPASLTSVPITPLWSDRVPPTPAWTAGTTEVTSLAVLDAPGTRPVTVAAGDDVGTLRLLRFDGRLAHVPLHLHSGAITHLLALEGGLLVTAGTDGRVMAVAEKADGQLTHCLVTHRERTWVSSLTTYHPAGRPRLLLAAFSDGAVEAFEADGHAVGAAGAAPGRLRPHPLPLDPLADASGLLCGIGTAGGDSGAAGAGPGAAGAGSGTGAQWLLLGAHDTVHVFDGRSTVPHSRHAGRVRALLALPGSGRYAVGDEHGNVSLCDLSAPAPLRTARHDPALAGGVPPPVTCLQLVSLAGRTALVSAAGNGTLRLWRLPGLQAVPGMLQAHTAPVNAMTCLPGRGPDRLLSGGADRVVRGWPIDEGTFGREPRAWNRVTATAVSPAAPHRLAVARASRVIIRDLATAERTTVLKGRRVTALAWPLVGGRRLLAAAVGDTVRCVDPGTGLRAGPDMTGHLLPVTALVAVGSADGDLLASAGADGKVFVWRPGSGEELARFGDHEFTVRCLATHHGPRRRLLASGGSDGNIRIWDADTRAQHGPTLKCDQGIINDLAFVAPAPDDDAPLIAAAGQDGTLKLWDPRTARAVRTLHCHDGELSAVTALRLPFERTAVAAAGKTSIRVWDTAAPARPLLQLVTGSPVETLKTVQDPQRVDSSILLVSGEAGSMAFRLHHDRL